MWRALSYSVQSSVLYKAKLSRAGVSSFLANNNILVSKRLGDCQYSLTFYYAFYIREAIRLRSDNDM